MTNATLVPAIFSGYTTLDAIVQSINSGGSAMFSVAEIAGYYAFDAATDNLDHENDVENLTADDFEAHLDVLRDAGAEFDYAEALANAEARRAYATECLHSGDA